jgi:hypothetical protein
VAAHRHRTTSLACNLKPPPFPHNSSVATASTRCRTRATPEQDSVSPQGHHRSPASPASSRTGSSTFSYRAPASPSPLSKQPLTSSSSSVSWRTCSLELNWSQWGLDPCYDAQLVIQVWTTYRRTMRCLPNFERSTAKGWPRCRYWDWTQVAHRPLVQR